MFGSPEAVVIREGSSTLAVIIVAFVVGFLPTTAHVRNHGLEGALGNEGGFTASWFIDSSSWSGCCLGGWCTTHWQVCTPTYDCPRIRLSPYSLKRGRKHHKGTGIQVLAHWQHSSWVGCLQLPVWYSDRISSFLTFLILWLNVQLYSFS